MTKHLFFAYICCIFCEILIFFSFLAYNESVKFFFWYIVQVSSTNCKSHVFIFWTIVRLVSIFVLERRNGVNFSWATKFRKNYFCQRNSCKYNAVKSYVQKKFDFKSNNEFSFYILNVIITIVFFLIPFLRANFTQYTCVNCFK